MTIKIYKKNVYGKENIYCANEKTAKAIRLISGQLTLTSQTIRGMEQLGFIFKEILASQVSA